MTKISNLAKTKAMDVWTFRPAVILQLDIILMLIIRLQIVSSCGIFTFLRMGNFTSSTPGALSSTSCAQYVQEVVSQHCVVIFSKTTCPYCRMAKNVFNEIGATYKVIELDEHSDGRRLQEALAQVTGAESLH
ncbi:glutaredoxin 2 isoform X4 [Pempheris klunzingeri]|uniref:glutaredoxin 2 isoform X4 n=1 Tax=Pempheris klunzingeri TaxID=3127111 RepID=UPI00398053A7